jgi:hypothetical protein
MEELHHKKFGMLVMDVRSYQFANPSLKNQNVKIP